MSKYILVTSGGRSRLGKDVAVASVASLLKCCGLSVAIVKCVPYINVDAAKLSPYFHGGVFVTDDGSKADMDVGTYFRFTHISSFITRQEHCPIAPSTKAPDRCPDTSL